MRKIVWVRYAVSLHLVNLDANEWPDEKLLFFQSLHLSHLCIQVLAQAQLGDSSYLASANPGKLSRIEPN